MHCCRVGIGLRHPIGSTDLQVLDPVGGSICDGEEKPSADDIAVPKAVAKSLGSGTRAFFPVGQLSMDNGAKSNWRHDALLLC